MKCQSELVFSADRRWICSWVSIWWKANTAKEELTVCGYCNGFYSSRYFYKPKVRCTSAECGPSAVSVPLSVAMHHDVQDEFCMDILSKFYLDAVGSDEAVIAVGKHLYRRSKQRKAKKPNIRKSCMRDMRWLASLTTAFKDATHRDNKVLSSEDTLHCTHFEYLECAVEELSRRCDANSELRAGT